METVTLAIERLMLEISLKRPSVKVEIRRRTRVEDVIAGIAQMKWSWVRDVAP